ncbi:DUF4843 domain-containing protein [Pedobacter nyackensis]|uniref:DUF4843 domain-containing protein n=1 Tax=Pedobacter nyackensis TaxID=475255 RepID=UPI00293106D5|nr:DUF4843 domain-containing protein [Pedobacter nyackensis]
MKKILIISMICIIFTACKKQELQQYSEKSRIYLNLSKSQFYAPFPTSTARDLRIDYAPQNSSKKTDTLRFNIQSSGAASKIDRSFIFERSTVAGNAKEGLDFDILDKNFVIPAGMFNTIIRVVVRRTPGMAVKPLSFSYNLKANDNFELGPDRDSTQFFSNTGVIRLVALNVTAKDIVVKPENWDSFIAKYFGVYSEVKFRFIIDVLAKTSFPTTTSAGVMNRNKTTLNTALVKYNTTHPEKLKDENGNEISF